MEKLIIAIDGHSSCGKSTLAKALASSLGYVYLDSGAMYRATTLYFLDNQIDFDNPEQISEALKNIDIQFSRKNNQNRTLLNGKDVEEEIRSMRVSGKVSPVAAISAVRRAMVHFQRQAGSNKGIVMDGRDIGSVVFPDAELKIFLTAELETRVNRRYLELLDKQSGLKIEEVRTNLEERDHIDSTRADSPLVKASDAILIDNTNLSRAEQLAMTMALAKERMKKMVAL